MKNNRKKRRLIFVGSIFLISLAALYFVISNFRENIVFFYSPSELQNVKDVTRTIKIGGMVKEGSVKKIDALNADFVVTDFNEELLVHYTGMLPDLFRDKQGVVALGYLNDKRTEFTSRELLIKHDENYMPPEVANSLKEKITN